MCGIVAYTGIRPALPILISGLKRLEYRGYDSAGIAVETKDQIVIRKSKGKVKKLSGLLDEDETDLAESNCGIAHTRWATHGPPTTENAHPHAGRKNGIALVHNGIIENHRALRDKLTASGYIFISETDTEVLAHLVDSLYQGDLLDAVIAALKEVEGTFGIACMVHAEPGTLIVGCRGSTIVLGVGKNGTIVASDASAIIKHTRQAIYLDDNDVAQIKGSELDVRSLDTGSVSRQTAEIDWTADAAEKGGYEHYMLKEIFEQPESIRNTLRGRLDSNRGNALLSGLNLNPRELAELHRVLIVGCGTSMNAGLVGEYAIEDFAGVLAEVEQAAEFRYRNPIVNSSDLVVAISQSGETADTLAAVREATDKGALVSGLVNTVGSTIARETGRGVYLHAGPEISVASTKAFTSQVSVLLMMALKFARSRRMSRDAGCQFVKEIKAISGLVERVLEQNDAIAKVAERYLDQTSAFFIGRGYMYPVALEGALKLKEISYIHAEGYHAAELKHGPIALLEKDVPVIALCNDGPGKDKTLGNVAECQARDSRVLGIVTEGDSEAIATVDDHITVPACPLHTAVVPSTVALQLLSYHVARLRDCSIDQPRNLAKSVTVE